MSDLVEQIERQLAEGDLTEPEALELLAQLETLAGDRQRGKWHPYPWQIPPGKVSAQGLWILLGGRGTGKTDACARYVVEHIEGPACDTRIRGGHRIGIIAPTIGDAVESCVEGPSGLKAHDPRVQLRSGVGGHYVKFPGGSVGKLFGAHTPDDIERLRSGGNRCIAAGTLVSTERGAVPIEQVRVGDRVWTRSGLRPVTHTHDNGVRPVWKLETEAGRVLYATGDHKIATPSGWAQLKDLNPSTTVLTWDYGQTLSTLLTSSPGTGTAGGCTRTVTTGTPSAGCCTARSTKKRTVRSLTGCTCTTTTTTPSTTTPATSSPRPRLNTGPSITTSEVPPGTPRAGTRPGPTLSTASTSASSAANRSAVATRPAPRSAPCAAASAGTPHTRSAGRGRTTCASCAEPGSNAKSAFGPLRPRLVRDRVLRVTSLTSRPVAVHDLTVQADHEFIAGGVLVANCLVWLEEIAAMRQLAPALEHSAFGLRIGSRPHYVGSTTPKPRKELRDMLADPLTLTTRGRTRDAHHLDASVRAQYEKKYAGTRIGRQELEGEILDDVEGALWTWDNIDRGRVDPERRPELIKVAVAMDPSVSVTEDSDLCGIVAAGLGVDRCGYVLEDRSARVAGSPAARRAWMLWRDVHANDMVYEENQGMAWVAEILRRVWYEMQAEGLLPAGAPPLRPKRATLGKRLRAEPIAALWEMTIPRARMVGSFVDLEEQMTTWVPDEDPKSPDRVDAMVHALSHLMGNDVPAGVGHATDVPMSAIHGGRRPRTRPRLFGRRR